MIFDGVTSEMEWQEGFPLSLPALAEPEALAEPTGLRTTAGLGGFGSDSKDWQFEPGLAVDLVPTGLWMSCSGFRIPFRSAPPFRMTYLGNGRWKGDAPESIVPDLFSTRYETQDEENIRILETAAEKVALLHRNLEGLREIACVCSSELSREDLCEEVRKVLEEGTSLETAWHQLAETRNHWASGLPEDENPDPAMQALEQLVGKTSFHADVNRVWIDGDAGPISSSMMPSVLEALAKAGFKRVTEILKALPTILESEPSWPVLAQGICRLPFTSETSALKAEMARLCEQQIRQQLGSWTPSSSELPQWKDPGNSLTPEISGGALVLFDYACLLIAEMEACSQLAEQPDLFQDERKALQQTVESRFWSSSRKSYVDQTPNGEQTKRVTAATLLPLLWQHPPKEHLRQLAALPGEPALRHAQGIQQWEHRDQDPTPPPIRLETQHVLLPALDRLKEEDASILSAALHRAQIPEESQAPTLLHAALRVRLLPYTRKVNPHLEKVPRWVLYLEKHRTGVIGTAATLLFLAPVLGVMLIASNPRLNPTEEHILVGQAQTERTLNRLESAENKYTTVLDYSESDARFARYHLQRGNIRYQLRKYPEALQDYQQAIALDPEGYLHEARWNVAQTHRESGELEKARLSFQSYLDEYAEELPDQAERARLALHLLTPEG